MNFSPPAKISSGIVDRPIAAAGFWMAQANESERSEWPELTAHILHTRPHTQQRQSTHTHTRHSGHSENSTQHNGTVLYALREQEQASSMLLLPLNLNLNECSATSTANVWTMGSAACACSAANGVAGPRRDCGDGHAIEKLKSKATRESEKESKEGWQLACPRILRMNEQCTRKLTCYIYSTRTLYNTCSAHSGKLESDWVWTSNGTFIARYCNEHPE